jgi:hypothetical protein
MINIIIGFALGFFIATMGLTGVAQAVDEVIDKIKTTTITIEKSK